MIRVLRSALWSLAMVSTSYLSGAAAGQAPAVDPATEARVEEARAVTRDFLKSLGGAMKQQMQSGGPVAALDVCRKVAPEIADEISLKKGWKVTRVGTRVRNAMLGMPDAWEQQVLLRFEERAAKGESFQDMEYYEVVNEPFGSYLRYMKAIGVKPLCLVCHGPREQLADPVRARLEQLYPHDRAVGYQAGDLRGAVSIKQPLGR